MLLLPVRSWVLGPVTAVALLAAACTAGPSASSPPASAPPASSPGGTRTIDVRTTDALRFEPEALTVTAGERIRFVVSNPGTVDHEFYVGDEAAQAEHAEEMAGGGMMHDDPNGIEVPAGETMELEIAFDQPAELLIGCHVPGHYEAGMRATLTVEG